MDNPSFPLLQKKITKPLIIHVIDTLRVGGAETLLVQTVKKLTSYNHIICYLDEPSDLKQDIDGHEVYRLDLIANKNFLKVVFKLKTIIKREKPALVHSHLLKSTWTSRMATFNTCPLFFTVHNTLSDDAFRVNRLSYYFERLTYTSRQILIAVSRAALDDYDKWIGVKGPAVVLYNPIGSQFFEHSINVSNSNETLKLVAVGTLRRQKNYMKLLQSFLHLDKTRVTLDIFGEGDLDAELQNFIDKHHLPINLKGVSFSIEKELPKYDAFVMASSFEGFGIAVAEAMAVGLPVLLSDIPVFHEVSGDNAFFFDPENEENIAAVITGFMQLSTNEKTDLSKKMKSTAMEIASEENYIKRLEEIYQSKI